MGMVKRKQNVYINEKEHPAGKERGCADGGDHGGDMKERGVYKIGRL